MASRAAALLARAAADAQLAEDLRSVLVLRSWLRSRAHRPQARPTDDQVRAAVGAAFFVLSVVYVVQTVRELTEG